MEKVLVALDIDGTIITDNQQVTQKTIQVLYKLSAMGVKIMLLTARKWSATEKIYNDIGLDIMVGNWNGALLHKPNEYRVKENYMSNDIVNLILEDRKIKPYYDIAYLEGYDWSRSTGNSEVVNQSFFPKSAKKYEVLDDLDILNTPFHIYGSLITIKPDCDYKKLVNYIEWKYGDKIRASYWELPNGEFLVDFSSKFATKGEIVKSYVDKGYKVISFGDQFNDISMFKESTLSIAMKNASDSIKKYADMITSYTNNDSGVAIMLEELFNLKK